MDGENLVDELSKCSNWEVYKDAFAPPPTRRTRPWERAPVSAHAPRLQGQKIWKKPDSNLRSHENRKNDDAQVELHREGMGARKKMRCIGEKENISAAKWLVVSGDNENEITHFGVASPSKKELMTLDTDALLVPRKRTNANHLITPRKAGRKIPLADASLSHSQVLASSEPAREDEVMAVNPRTPTEKPGRRGKSMRRSTRRLTRNEGIEEEVVTPAKELKSDPQFDAVNGTPASEAAPEPAFSYPVDIFGTLSQQPPPAAVDDGEEATVQVIEAEEMHTAIVDSVPLGNGTSKAEELSSTNLERSSPPTTLGSLLPLHEDTNAEDQDGAPPAIAGTEDESTQAASVKITTTESLVPTKMGETPKKNRMSSRNSRTPQRSVIRRSTRATRSSSGIANNHSDQSDEGKNQTSNELSDQATSPYKSEPISRPCITNIILPPRTQIMHELQGIATDFETTDNTTISDVESQLTPETPLEVHDEQVVMQKPGCNVMDSIQEALNLEADENVMSENSSEENSEFGQSEDLEGNAFTVPLEAQQSSDSGLEIHDLQLPKHDPERISTPPPATHAHLKSDDISEGFDNLEELEPISLPMGNLLETLCDEAMKDLPETSIPDPSMAELVETTCQNSPAFSMEEDDTDLLRNFLTRVKANKAAKVSTSIPKRKRSLPHSPIQLPLGTAPTTSSPPSPKTNDDKDELNQDEFDESLRVASPSKRRKLAQPEHEQTEAPGLQPRATRRNVIRSIRLPQIQAPVAAPSFIPLRRLNGQDGDNTVTLRRNAEKELASLTKFNTRRNKGTAALPAKFLAKKAEEKEDPASKHKALKEAFDEKESAAKKGGKNKRGKTVVWAEELAQFQTGSKPEKEPDAILPPVAAAEEKVVPKEKKSVKVGGSIRSKMSLGMAANGTPAPKRKVRERKASS